MKSLKPILLFTLLGLITPHGASYSQDDFLELKTTYSDGTPRTIYKGTWRGKIANLELYDSVGTVLLKKTEYFETLGELCYFKEAHFSNQFDVDSIDKEVDILLDSIKILKIRIDKKSTAHGTILLWINGDGSVEHAVWYWYSGITKLFMRKSMNYAEKWKVKPMTYGKGIVIRRNVDFK